jgi:hypothetical protein
MLICPPHIPLRRVEAAVARIRAMRGVNCDNPCRFPDDLGCETQLYLGAGVYRAFPLERMSVVAQVCGVAVPDAPFFTMLISIAENSDRKWMKRAIVEDASSILLGLPVEPLPLERAAKAWLSVAGAAKAPLDLLPGMRAAR